MKEWDPCVLGIKVLDCDIGVSDFELQALYYVYFRSNTLGKGMNPGGDFKKRNWKKKKKERNSKVTLFKGFSDRSEIRACLKGWASWRQKRHYLIKMLPLWLKRSLSLSLSLSLCCLKGSARTPQFHGLAPAVAPTTSRFC